ncbi:hypothetical protein H4582DRAFT_2069283 [Lactarius indigo]|nr:hypothetical protein H4582DRAFT_2089961 [Lactarius indigo]KAI9445936.1 hypothetical protein H4582DRAFT_2069283 [Lactarius indigo]
MPGKTTKKGAKPNSVDRSKGEKDAALSDDETSDEDYDSGLESEGSYPSSDFGSIASGELHWLAADLEDEVGGATSEESPSKQDIEITDEQASMLQKHTAEFRAADADGRLKIVQDSVDRIERHWRQGAEFDRKVVETLVRRYLYNKCRQERKRFSFRRKRWTYHDILIDHHRQELDKMAVEMSGSTSGSRSYLGCYRKAVKLIDERLDEDTRVKYRAEAKKWAEQGVPPRQQQRMFEKHGIHTIRDFSETMYRQYGVRVAILGGYCDDDGPSIMFYDNNDELGGTSFKARYKGWSKDPLVEEFSRWTAESFGEYPADSGEEDRKRKDKTPKVKLPMDENGYPVLPKWEDIDREGLMYKKVVIGKFMSEMYRIAAGGCKGRVPWARIHAAQGDFIAAEYLPEGVTLTQYHHIRLDDANSLLKHWIQRRAAGEIPFRFKKVDKANRHYDGEHSTGGGSNGQSQEDGAGSPSSSANGQQPHEELPMQEDGGILPPHPPNPPPPPPPPHTRTCTRPRPRPRIIMQHPAPIGSSRAGPAQERSPDDHATADTPPSKRQKVDRRLTNAQNDTRRSARVTRPTERAKQIQ